jgi:signal transduction histidine kinase
MTTIRGYAALLGREDLDPEARGRFSGIITHSVDTFVQMTQEILDYARGGGPLQPQEIQVGAFIEDLCTFIERDFSDKGLTLVRELHYTGPLLADEIKLRRALYNIASNARDAMEAGGSLTISASRAGGSVELCLRDTGPGIPETIRDTLFEPFVTCGKAMGTGLGLAIAKKTAEDHGGAIAVESVPGQGATFIVRLPLS